MIRTLGLLFLAACASASYADCAHPQKPVELPDGKTASREAMAAANTVVTQYNAAMAVYLGCIKTEYDALIARMSAESKAAYSNANEERKTQLVEDFRAERTRLHKVYVRNNNTAVDELEDVADRYNRQLRVFKTRNSQ